MIEHDLAFSILRSALGGNPPHLGTRPIDASTWWSLFRLMQQNHVAAMTADTIATLDVPREVKIPWLAERDKTSRWHRYQREVQQEIVDTMSRHGIDTLVLKGTHTAQYYPIPELREFGDLDLYFYDRHEEADNLMHQKLGVSITNDAHHHSKYNYRGVTIESHYDFVNTHYPPSNRRYEALLKELAPSPTFEVFFLLRHMACHFAASRITLRDLVDWTLTCRALQDKVDWSMVQDTVKQYGMEPFFDALNTIVSQHLSNSATQPPSHSVTQSPFEHDLLNGSVTDHATDGLARLGWKLRRWRANRWKHRMVFSDSETSLLLASLTSHSMKPASILHKM